MDESIKRRLQERIVNKVSKSILYKLDAFDRMCQRFHEVRYKSKAQCISRSKNAMDQGVNYAFESFYYTCLEKWEKGEIE